MKKYNVETIDYEDVEKSLDLVNKKMVDLYTYIGFSRQSANNFKRRGEIPIKYAQKISEFFNIGINSVIDNKVYEAIRSHKKEEILEELGIDSDKPADIPVHMIDEPEAALIDSRFFKHKPNTDVRAMQLEDQAMEPLMRSGSWALFIDANSYSGDGLYVVKFKGGKKPIVRLVQLDLQTGKYEILSQNNRFKDYTVAYDSLIVGKVVMSMM